MSSEAITRNDLQSVLNSVLPIFYPIGCYFETSDGTFNPNVEWGGTWVLETEGQVHVSAGSNYTVSGALSNTSDGGNKNAIIPYHKHNIPERTTGAGTNHTHSLSSHTHTPGGEMDDFTGYKTGYSAGRRTVGSGSASWYTWTANATDGLLARATTGGPSNNTSGGESVHTHKVSSHDTDPIGKNADGSTATSDNRTNANMQPYINVYRWHRIA